MVSAGVQSIRVTFNWGTAQPFPSFKALSAAGFDPTAYDNVGGVPTAFDAIDKVVVDAASRGIRVLPVVIYAPSWDAPLTPLRVRSPGPVRAVRQLPPGARPSLQPEREHPAREPGYPEAGDPDVADLEGADHPQFLARPPVREVLCGPAAGGARQPEEHRPGRPDRAGGLPNYSWYYLASL